MTNRFRLSLRDTRCLFYQIFKRFRACLSLATSLPELLQILWLITTQQLWVTRTRDPSLKDTIVTT